MIQRKEHVVWEIQAYGPTYRGNSSDQVLGGVLPWQVIKASHPLLEGEEQGII